MLSISQTLFLNGVETRKLLLDFAQQLRRENADVPDIDFTSPDAACISRTLIRNQNNEAREKGSWVPLKILIPEAAKAVHTGWCCLWVCVQLSES